MKKGKKKTNTVGAKSLERREKFRAARKV
jgi:hypothetical protein